MRTTHAKVDYLIPATGIFFGLPLLLWALGDFPRRSLLKESLSVLFLLSFSLMLGQFFLARGNRNLLAGFKMSTILRFHKTIAYTVVGVFLVHPFLIVVPRYFEAGVAPSEAFTTIITAFHSPGIVLGMIAWVLMFILGITSFVRGWLPMKYRTWRYLHGVLSVLFIVAAGWHVVDLGRHADRAMSVFIIALATAGVELLARTYFLEQTRHRGRDHADAA